MTSVYADPILTPRTKPAAPRRARPIEPAMALAALPTLLAKVELQPGSGPPQGRCWLWRGHRIKEGYGRVHVGDSMRLVHRLMWVACAGRDIPAGLTADHLCRQRSCINPFHLQMVSQRVNIMRGENFAASNARRTHCPRGHLYADGNLTPSELKKGGRACLTCSREKGREQAALISAAHKTLGLQRAEYRAQYGSSRATAENVLRANGIDPASVVATVAVVTP